MKEGELIEAAAKIAARSPVRRFQTGAVIFRDGEILSTGWSHASDKNMTNYRSVHAEMHALSRLDVRDAVGSIIAIVTISRKSGNRTDGTPCFFCLSNLKKIGIKEIVFTTPGGGQKTIYPEFIDMYKILEKFEPSRKAYVGHLF